MLEAELVGIIVGGFVVIGSFVALVVKILKTFTEPINDLKLVIQRLDDTLKSMTKDVDSLRRIVDGHGEDIDRIALKVNEVETLVKTYHR